MKRSARPIMPQGPDYWLLSIVVVLLIVGLVMIFSSSTAAAYADGERPTHYLERQVVWLLAGAAALYFFYRIDYRFWRTWPLPLVIIGGTIVVLGLVLFANRGSEQAGRWWVTNLLGGSGSSIQPAEFAKVTITLYIAMWLASKGDKLRQLSYGLIPFGIVLGLTDGLVALQPNLSTAALIAAIALVMFWVAGADVLQLAATAGIAVCGAVLSAMAYPYQMERVTSFLHADPLADATGAGYHSYHSLMSLISGNLLGVGLGNSWHKRFFAYVAHTDAILAITGEEFGLIGVLAILALFLAFAYRGVRIALKASDSYGSILAIGLTSWIVLQAAIHAAVVCRAIPFTGMPLPFVSYGGSALISEMAGVGLLLSISKNATKESVLDHADFAFGRRNGRPRLSAPDRR